MSDALITIAIKDMTVEPLGVKEAAVMALEHLGGVQVLQVEVREPEQMKLGGAATERRTSPCHTPPARQDPDKPASAHPAPGRPKRSVPTDMFCCLTCASFQKEHGQDAAGSFYWGKCGQSQKLVYSLRDQCEGWERRERRA